MARTGRPKAKLVLTKEEHETLTRYARRSTIQQRIALRARIVLNCAEGFTNKEVAADMGVTPQTVGKWRSRFIRNRIEGLQDEPRPGAARKITDDLIEDIVVRTLESAPKNATHWSTREMAKRVGLGRDSISRIWRAFGLKPHRTKNFVLS